MPRSSPHRVQPETPITNANQKRDPQTHQTRKGNQHYFGAKAYIGADSNYGAVQSVRTSAASVHGKHMLPDLLHGEEKKFRGDAGYQRQTEVIHAAAPDTQDMVHRRVKKSNGAAGQE